MCQHPITIRNKSKIYQPYRDKYFLSVPCGDCVSCRLEKQSSWYVRAYWHFKDYPFAIMYTLTYSDKHLPLFSSLKFPDFKDIPCFSHKHISDFLDNFRKYLFRHKKISNKDFTYIISCEYGAKEGTTKRPHYHCIFYFKNKVDTHFIHDLVRQFWVYKHGFCYPDIKSKNVSPDNPWYAKRYPNYQKLVVQDNVKSAKYVSKYVTKDLEYFNNPKLQAFLNDDLKINDPVTYKERFYEIKRFLPKHWQSQKFGIAFNSELKKDLDGYLLGLKWTDNAQQKKNGSFNYFRVPQYNIDKFKYINCLYPRSYDDSIETKRLFNTELLKFKKGLPFDGFLLRRLRKAMRKYDIIRYRTRRYNSLLVSHLNKQINDYSEKIRTFCQNITNSSALRGILSNCNEFNYLVTSINNNNTIELNNIINYLIYFRGRSVIKGKNRTLFDKEGFPLDISERFNINLFSRSRSLDKFLYLRDSASKFTYAEDFTKRLFSDMEQLRPYEIFCSNFFKYFSHLTAQSAKKCLDLQKFYKELKYKRYNYNNLIYDCKV